MMRHSLLFHETTLKIYVAPQHARLCKIRKLPEEKKKKRKKKPQTETNRSTLQYSQRQECYDAPILTLGWPISLVSSEKPVLTS